MTTVSTGNAISPELKCSCMTSQRVCKATSHVVCGWAHKTACIFFCATIVCLCWFIMWLCDTWACYIDRCRRNILITLFPPAHTRERERERERERGERGQAARENWPYGVYGWFGPYVFGEQLKASAFLRVLGIWCHRGGQVPQENTHDLSFITGLERTHLCRKMPRHSRATASVLAK